MNIVPLVVGNLGSAVYNNRATVASKNTVLPTISGLQNGEIGDVRKNEAVKQTVLEL